mmetsp:Transcript_82010/g.217365  ORF Transcript_82010/g.217365 Transcript_82010/m.217365 type:complete len:215 (+) Transcript_82010:955-1599(+)
MMLLLGLDHIEGLVNIVVGLLEGGHSGFFFDAHALELGDKVWIHKRTTRCLPQSPLNIALAAGNLSMPRCRQKVLCSTVWRSAATPERGHRLDARSAHCEQGADGVLVHLQALEEQRRSLQVRACTVDVPTAAVRDAAQQPEAHRRQHLGGQSVALLRLHLRKRQKVLVDLAANHTLGCPQASLSIWQTLGVPQERVSPTDVELQLTEILELLQ